ncbi:hypothetical protein [Pectinatus frisingensis]|uniref:hypothetical protein n=1 Tax=Pectinatus frisingensis TaxID=865 RepID=UPI0018C4C617|nr:hypothetical protein [Pectinatus frisingensis]
MRLDWVLSKEPQQEYVQVEGFLTNKRGNIGQQASLDNIGKVMLNFFCSKCDSMRTFSSKGKISCIFVNKQLISIDCVMSCECGTNVEVWFLVECDNNICGLTPRVKVIKRRERLSDLVKISEAKYEKFSGLLEKADQSYHDGLGAGSIVYLRKILEQITIQTARASGIVTQKGNGHPKPFKEVLTKVDEQRAIIPTEFSKNGYKLFGELSDVVHGDYDEQLGLQKYGSLRRLVVGVLDNVKNNEEMMKAIGQLGWNQENGDCNE